MLLTTISNYISKSRSILLTSSSNIRVVDYTTSYTTNYATTKIVINLIDSTNKGSNN